MDKLRILIAVLVTLIWAAGYILSFVDRSFNAPAELSGIMLGVVTWLFGSELQSRLKNSGVKIRIGKGTEDDEQERADQPQKSQA